MPKQFYFKQFSLALVCSLNVKTVLFRAIQYSVIHILVLFDSYQVLPIRATVDRRAMAMKGYSAFPKASALPEPHHQIVKCHNRTYSTSSAYWAVWFSFISRTPFKGCLTPPRKSSWCILQLKLTGQKRMLGE